MTGIASGQRPTLARLKRWAPPLVGALLFAAALAVLRHELAAVSQAELHAALLALPAAQLLLALSLTGLNYLVLTGYDQLALRYVGKQPGRLRVMLASFTAYAISNSVGFALVSGTSVRYRFYSRWGVEAMELGRIVLFSAATFWVGFLVLGGGYLVVGGSTALAIRLPASAMQTVGATLLVCAAAYVLACFRRPQPVTIGGIRLAWPRPQLAVAQLLVSAADWALAAAIFWALLSPGSVPYGPVLGAFLAAQILGIVSHVPGGLGVFEGTMLLLLGAHLPHADLLTALLLFRLAYYLLPLVLALAILLIDEARRHRGRFARAGGALGGVSVELAPRVLAALLFLAGALLLFSGTTAAEAERLRWLARFLPLGVLEAAHCLGSVVGVGLLFLARGVAQRLHRAYTLALVGLLAGIAASLPRGDWEEALVLALLLVAFVPSRPDFDRRTALFDLPFSPGWVVALATAFGASIWLGLFAYRDVEYARELWWRFSLEHDVSRSLRASAGAAVALLVLGSMRLLHRAPATPPPPSAAELADARRVIATEDASLPDLGQSGDRALLFDAARSAFLTYAVRGRSWIAFGDPVGPAAAASELIRSFIDRATDFGGVPVFYLVSPAHLSSYADAGMVCVRLGEAVRVGLADPSLDGSAPQRLCAVEDELAPSSDARYLAWPGDVALPPILHDLAAVVPDDGTETPGSPLPPSARGPSARPPAPTTSARGRGDDQLG
jgi:phosphatidylglycerol lysyltransferase